MQLYILYTIPYIWLYSCITYVYIKSYLFCLYYITNYTDILYSYYTYTYMCTCIYRSRRHDGSHGLSATNDGIHCLSPLSLYRTCSIAI